MEVQAIYDLVQHQPLWLALLLLAMAAGLEYVFPPFPGDSVTVVGAVLIPVAGWPWWAVFAALIVGSMGGAAVDWRIGRWVADNEERDTWIHRFLRREKVASKIAKIKDQFRRHGSWYIAANRFLPAFRAIFFVAAGLARLRLAPVLVFAGLSAALWNALLLAVGSYVGYNLQELMRFVRNYSTVVLIGVGIVAAAWVLLSVIRRRAREV